ncbi:MAG: chemotaxis protein CheW, partial [Methanosarcinales archaeon]
KTINNHEVFVLKDQVIPLLRLHDLLGIPMPLRSFNPLDNRIPVVIIEKDNKNLGLIVDTLIGKQEIIIKSLGDLFRLKGFAGATILGNGKVSLILDIANLLS